MTTTTTKGGDPTTTTTMTTTTTKGGDPTTTTTTTYYSQLPPSSSPSQDLNHHQHHHFHHHHLHPDHQDQCYILLPPYPRRRFRYLSRSLSCFFSILLFSIAIFLLWPSDPDLKIVRLHLNNVHIHTSPSISMDISMALTVKVHNRDFYSLDYRSFVVSIDYRGRQLGFVNSKEGHVKARSSSYVNATLQLNGIEILHDVFYLLEDLAKGSIPLDTVTQIQGQLGLLFFKVPIEAKVSCEIDVNTDNQTVIRQNCYPN